MIKVIVTGGSGFIGSYLIKALLKKYVNNIAILSIDNYLTGRKDNEISDVRVTYINDSTINISNYQYFEADILYHFGEYSRISQSFEEPQLVLENNFVGTSKIIDFCSKNNCKLIYSGSSAIFGNNMEDQHLSPYSWIKAKNIELINNYNKWYGLDFIIVYLYNVYGEGQISSGKYSTVIGIFERQYLNNESLSVVFPGTQKRNFTHIDDTVNGIMLASLNGKTNENYTIRDDIEYSILDIAQLFHTKYHFINSKKGDRVLSSGDNTKMTELGWKTEKSLANYIFDIKLKYIS